MLVNTRINKENCEDKTYRKGVTCESADAFRGREFGTELTNNTDASSDAATDEKSPTVNQDVTYESKVPHEFVKTHKMSDHYSGTSISMRCRKDGNVPSIYKGGKDLTTLEGEELKEALNQELKLRKKELNKDISFQDVINFRTPELVGEYVGQCVQWMKCQEEEFKIKKNYMDSTPTKKLTNKKKGTSYKVTRQDRAVAIDLVIEIHRKYGLVPETLFVAVSTFDRYLSVRKEPIKRSKDVEAIAIASLLLSSKYEDIYPPALDEMIKMMNRPSTRKEILEWEFTILKTLVFQITVPTPLRFLERFASTSIVYQNSLTLAQYIIELALYDFDIQYNLAPSEIASIALFAAVNFDIYANKLNDKQKWSSEISKESSIKKIKITEYFNTYFIDLAYRVERELKVNDITIKYPQYQFVDNEPLALFNPIK